MDAGVKSRLARVSTATLTTCLFKRGFKNAFLQNVHPLNPNARPMVGPAFTLRYIPAREDLDVLEAYANFEHPQRKRSRPAPKGHVLVMTAARYARPPPPATSSSPA
jgi:regulator of RNase E activity RraA